MAIDEEILWTAAGVAAGVYWFSPVVAAIALGLALFAIYTGRPVVRYALPPLIAAAIPLLVYMVLYVADTL